MIASNLLAFFCLVNDFLAYIGIEKHTIKWWGKQWIDFVTDHKSDHRSRIYQLGSPGLTPAPGSQIIIMGDDDRLPKMPKKPTLIDFFKHRFIYVDHLLQSANLALKNGLDSETVFSCLIHDIAVCGFIRGDHGYWGEMLVAPYVSEKVAWSIRKHQALRFFSDESVGYTYPEAYTEWFGEDYQPDPYIVAEYEDARNNKWYMSARIITMNDVYSFDPDVKLNIDDFTDIIGRHFRQPEEGLGFDNSPCAHMWRTMIRPTKFL
jgi:hypothetical protein